MDRRQKETVAAQMREAGAKLREIGDHFRVSPERARQLVKAKKGRSEEVSARGLTLEAELLQAENNPARAINCLRCSCLTADKIVAHGPSCLYRVTNMGPKTARQIARALERMGKIANAEEWLQSR